MQIINKVAYSFILLLTTLVVFSQQPNVIVILADDIGTGDISYYQKLYEGKVVVETPNIDKLAQSGVVFTNAHSPAALCAPSRYAVMTGNYNYRSFAPWGVWGAYEKSPLEDDGLTLGKLMKNAGYATSFFGKWHMGGDWNRLSDSTEIYRGPRYKPELDIDVTRRIGGGPHQNGFDYSFLLPSGVQDVPYMVHENDRWLPLQPDSEIGYISQEKMSEIGVTLDKSEGLGDLNWDPHLIGPMLANKAVTYIEKQAKADKPFFLYYCSQAVHLPHTPPDSLNGTKIAGSTGVAHMDMIVELDQQIAMMVAMLKKKGIYENTLIIFTSDNGGLTRPETLATGHQPSSIFTGGKNKIEEGGHRVPFIVSWPAKIKTNRTNQPAIGLDILATLAALTEQQIPEGQAVDSYDLLPLIYNKKKAKGHPDMIIQGGTGREAAIYDGSWKLVIQFDPKDKTDQTRTPKALYNLDVNIKETPENNLIDRFPEKAQILFDRYNELRDKSTTKM